MKITPITASIPSLAFIITGLANANDERLLEQGSSIYFCETAEDANGLVETYTTGDDIAVHNYVDSRGMQGCGRFPPIAALRFYILHSTERDGIVKIRLTDNSEYWIDNQQAKDQIAYNDQLRDLNSRQAVTRTKETQENQLTPLDSTSNSHEENPLINERDITKSEIAKSQNKAQEACEFIAKEAADKYVLQVIDHMRSDYLGHDNFTCWIMFKSGYTPFPAEVNFNAKTGRYRINNL